MIFFLFTIDFLKGLYDLFFVVLLVFFSKPKRGGGLTGKCKHIQQSTESALLDLQLLFLFFNYTNSHSILDS
ncbi:hypothetical protein ES332_D08G082900v1 [Gossypium tomentosum]|uniref:Uncharacterized protein n=1 Tax=Gossypium tomentosum TaxID=34277 RepID=A0A5D2JS31_GOSTO|nr:hypothetical protein ES332_D08G082900v1 [Gossypium tomentosum]